MFHLRETNVRQKIAQLIFSLHKDIVFCQVVIPYKGQFKNLEYTIKCAILHLEKKKKKQTKSICCNCLTDTTPANLVLAFRSIN